MDGTLIIPLIYGIVFAVVIFLIAFLVYYKYLVMEKRCTAKTTGTVIRYTFTNRGGQNSGICLPIVAYTVEGKEYKVTGPVYKSYRTITLKSIGQLKTEQEYTTDIYSQTFRHKIKGNSFGVLVINPMSKLFPKGSQIDVFYDPTNPKLAYVLRYANLKGNFWLLFIIGICIILLTIVLTVVVPPMIS